MSREPRFTATLGARQRLITGVLGLGLGFGVPFLASVALVASSGDPSLLILPLPFLGALWVAQGLAPAAYRLDEQGVIIERRWAPRAIAYAAISAADRRPRRVGGLGAMGLNGLFGSHGLRWNPWTGWHYLAIANTRDLVYLHTRRGLVVLSPGPADEFLAALTLRLAPLSTSPQA